MLTGVRPDRWLKMTSASTPRQTGPFAGRSPGGRKARDPRPGRPEAQSDDADPAGPLAIRRTPDLPAGLYVVSTPIGNLRDITLRALDTLASVDFVCAEDTRVTQKLLSAHGVSAVLRPYHDHNGADVRPGLLQEIAAGARVALVSDAGTPLVSDPGFKLVRGAVEQGSAVFAVPGASAPLAGLASSGLPSDRFLFAGFPPPRRAARRTYLAELRAVRATLIFFEGPSRLAACLADMADILGDRPAVVARELTKKFEEKRAAGLSRLAALYAGEPPPRGELVVLVGPPPADPDVSGDDLDAAILGAEPGRPLKETAQVIADRLGLRRRDVYARALHLRADSADEA